MFWGYAGIAEDGSIVFGWTDAPQIEPETHQEARDLGYDAAITEARRRGVYPQAVMPFWNARHLAPSAFVAWWGRECNLSLGGCATRSTGQVDRQSQLNKLIHVLLDRGFEGAELGATPEISWLGDSAIQDPLFPRPASLYPFFEGEASEAEWAALLQEIEDIMRDHVAPVDVDHRRFVVSADRLDDGGIALWMSETMT